MIEIDKIYNEDCLIGMKQIPDGTIDLIVTDPPYEFKDTTGAGAFGTCRGKSTEKKGRTYHAEVTPMSDGISTKCLNRCAACVRFRTSTSFATKTKYRNISTSGYRTN